MTEQVRPVQTLRIRVNLWIDTGTGEHGVGVGKKQYLIDELGSGAVGLMRIVKKTIDPLNIFNPGKVSFSRQNDRSDHLTAHPVVSRSPRRGGAGPIYIIQQFRDA